MLSDPASWPPVATSSCNPGICNSPLHYCAAKPQKKFIGSDSLDNFPKLFQIAAEIAAPLSQAKKISMVSDGTGEIGAAKLTGEVLQIMQSVPGLVKNLTGVDITATVARGSDLRSRVSRVESN